MLRTSFPTRCLAACLFAALFAAGPAMVRATPPPLSGPLPPELRAAAEQGLFDLPERSGLTVSALQTDWLVPVVLVGFPDSTLRYGAGQLQFAIFDTTHATATGSLPDYFEWASSGRLRVRGEVVGTAVLPHPSDFYTNSSYGLNPLSTPANDWGLVRDAVVAVDPDVNWNRFDRDGDGFVDMLWIVHAGLGAELTGNRSNFYSSTGRMGLGWSGGGVLETADPVNGQATRKVRIDRFSVLPEMSGFHPGALSEIGVYCHEFGHALGLPDLYDTSTNEPGANVGPGNWSLMSSGTYGGDGQTPESPVHPGAWPSLYLGWSAAVRPARDTLATLTPLTAGGSVLELWFQGEANTEHFLVESREQTSFDRHLPAPGLVVYQVDDAMIGARLGSNRVNTGPTQGLRLLEGDGDSDMFFGRNRGDASDALPGALGRSRLDDDTQPSLRSISGAVTSLAIESIERQAIGTRAHFRVRAPGWSGIQQDPDPAYALIPDPGRGHHAFITPQGREYQVFSDSRSGIAQVLLRTRSFEGDWTPPEPVSQSTAGAIQPTLATLGGDDLVVAWADRRAGSYQIWFRSRVGGVWSEERMLGASALGCTAPTIASDQRGRVFLAWLEQGQVRPSLKFLAFQWSMPFGTPITASDSTDSPSAPVIASSPAGQAWLLWPDRAGGAFELKFARYSPDSGLGSRHRFTANVTMQQPSADLVVDADGTAHVVWQQTSPSLSEIHFMRRAALGAFVPRDTVLEGSPGSLQNPSLTRDLQGGLHLVFERSTPLGMQLRYRRFAPGRGWDFRSTDLSDPAQGGATRAAVLGLTYGGASVLYANFDGFDYRPMSQRRRLDGRLYADAPPPPAPVGAPALRAGPNPLPAGADLVLRGAALAPGTRVELFDAAGRRLAEAQAGAAGGRAAFGGDVTGTLPAGLYFVRAQTGARARLVVVR